MGSEGEQWRVLGVRGERVEGRGGEKHRGGGEKHRGGGE